MRKTNQYIIKGEIELISGMRVGGSDDMLQIGGTDLTCIKNPKTGQPYIPGSSIKGKMRSGMEKQCGKISRNGEEPCGCALIDCAVCRVFGPHKNTTHQLGPTRIMVRDAPLLGNSFDIENKTESINLRNTGAAKHPRTVERVVPGVKFALEIGIQEFDIDEGFRYKNTDNKELIGREALLEVVSRALWELEQTGIGAGISKGYGRVKIHWNGQVEQSTYRSRNHIIVDAEK